MVWSDFRVMRLQLPPVARPRPRSRAFTSRASYPAVRRRNAHHPQEVKPVSAGPAGEVRRLPCAAAPRALDRRTSAPGYPRRIRGRPSDREPILMADDGAGAPGAGGFVVLREAAAGHWVVVGDVDRRPDRAKVTSTSRQGRRRPGARRRRGLRRAAAQRVAAGPATLGLPVRSAAMRVLVLGGTSFVGRAIAENAMRAGAG